MKRGRRKAAKRQRRRQMLARDIPPMPVFENADGVPIHRALNARTLFRWLRSKAPEDVVGRCGMPRQCVLAEFAESTGLVARAYISNRCCEECELDDGLAWLSEWADEYIHQIDLRDIEGRDELDPDELPSNNPRWSGPDGEITAAQAIESLVDALSMRAR